MIHFRAAGRQVNRRERPDLIPLDLSRSDVDGLTARKLIREPEELCDTLFIALPEKTLLKAVEFDNAAAADSQFKGCRAKDITVEMSDTGEGFQKIADVSLRDGEDDQRFPVSAQVPGRRVRLTVKDNQGPPDVTELAGRDARASD